jgi:hypothetical protein
MQEQLQALRGSGSHEPLRAQQVEVAGRSSAGNSPAAIIRAISGGCDNIRGECVRNRVFIIGRNVMRRSLLVGLMLTLAGCQQLPLTPEDIQARKFEPVPDKAVIYLVRDTADFSDAGAAIDLGDTVRLTTYPGTYYRWEVAPGPHGIQSFGGDTGRIQVKAERGKIHFVQQRVAGIPLAPESRFELINESQAREMVHRSVLLKPARPIIN